MINGAHTIIYAADAERARAFFRDTLGMPNVDAHDGWLIFKLPPAELGIHPTDAQDGKHELYLMCDDLPATMAELTAKGVEFTAGIEQTGFGLLTRLRVPGAGEIGLYQPRHRRLRPGGLTPAGGNNPPLISRRQQPPLSS